MSDSCQWFDCGQDIDVAYLGPSLTSGPLPALFYLSLSAQDSLCLDPFNQPAVYLSALPMRIFSLTLPGHENKLPPTQALHYWAQEIRNGNNFIATFVDKMRTVLDALFLQNALIEDRVAIAGLSRGAFLATHTAAKIPIFRHVLGFAPLTHLRCAKEFEELKEHPLVHSASLDGLVDALTECQLRFYIGNLDTRVGTRHCFDFIEKLSQAALERRIRSPQVELFITPSVGHQGHGTSKEIFHEGAQWIAEQLGAIDVL